MRSGSMDEAGGGSLQEMFRLELESQCALMNESLLALENKTQPQQALQNLMRAAHSIKGVARIVKNRSAERIAHAMEDCLVLAQHGAISLGTWDLAVLQKAANFLTRSGVPDGASGTLATEVTRLLAVLEKVSQGEGPDAAEVENPSPGPIPPPAPDPAAAAPLAGQLAVVPIRDKFLRVTAESLNRLMGYAGDSLAESRWLQTFLDSMLKTAKQQTEAEYLLESVQALIARTEVPENVRAGMADLARQLAGANKILQNGITELQAHERRASQVSHRLYMEVLRARMRPFSDISNAFPRMIRDLALSLGKEVRLEMSGENTQVDREVLAAIETALVHLLRNAIDHGCETPEERRRAGKPEECCVRLNAKHKAGMLEVSVSDDGAGVDPTLLRKAAAPHLKQAAARATDAELLDVLLLPGFTLKRKVTEISGRGVGLDLVHNVARRLRGSLRLENDPGRGMRFTLQLPLTISVVHALTVTVCDELYAIPLLQAERVTDLLPEHIVSIQGKRHFRAGKDHVPLAAAREIFNYPAHDPQTLTVVVLGERKPRAGLAVDALTGERELVVHPLDPRLGKIPGISGAALMDDGSPILIIDPEEMIQAIVRTRSS